MAEINQNYLYTDSNLWVEVKGNIARVGIDDYSQDEFGEIVYVDLPKLEQEYAKDDEICVIESVKTASDIYTPLSGEVVKINQQLLDNPKLINESCYDKGWLFEIEIADLDELKSLINPQDYQSYVS
ncbi:glycine cleavage system protein GcvH [Francisella tularensis]|uniref:glycine cleavage system protein GcvH n=1 Tax=Francisella tularensis TaxID=263 RepID=UPI000173E296|nr:glycine cleavage system protein GcvH [Francisella tularensis]ACD30935.1 glycine cleavage system H protein [Francisella tularensis subsp. mediasiatica FSC147]MBK2077746.1 glycine cleavage system protein GcvH [Francisella tularensis subsp. mediasiatica]MBK2101475.1 glycine cleavage system protein GcvH [Francisella tularensis subsp. mediasiatica]MBK2104204.1 glycine cleavage system protein GcvH [Francisella tularensis subsp. mediasiatica]MDN9003364.1 glycine cleavage system protein GcvH [Franc